MLIIGCDYHPSFQQIAFVDTATGELQERRLERESATTGAYHQTGGVRCCASCWWKLPKLRHAASRNGAASISIC
jgi:hypothetical protein